MAASAASGAAVAAPAAAQAPDPIALVDARATDTARIARQIWEWAELGYQEDKSSALLASELAKAGFKVTLEGLQDTYYDVLASPDKDIDIAWAGWGADWPSMMTVLPPLFDVATMDQPVLVLLTKSDKLARSEAAKSLKAAQEALPLARRALVVQRDLAALLEDEIAAVDRRLPRQHPQPGPGRVARAPAEEDHRHDQPEHRRATQLHDQTGDLLVIENNDRLMRLDTATGARVVVKHENHTPTGAFKVRGGLVYVDRHVRVDVIVLTPRSRTSDGPRGRPSRRRRSRMSTSSATARPSS